MEHPNLSCPKCQEPMQAGFIVDRSYAVMQPSSWSAGEAKYGKMIFDLPSGSLDLDVRKLQPVTCYRCTACSYLEFYAYPLPSEVAKS